MGNQVTAIKVDKNYKVIKKEIKNEKPIPNKVLDSIIPILKNRTSVSNHQGGVDIENTVSRHM